MANWATQGTDAMVEQPSERRWTQETGWETVRVLIGTRDHIQSALDTLMYAREVSITSVAGPVVRVEGRYPGGNPDDASDPANDTDADVQSEANSEWEIVWTPVEKTLLSFPLWSVSAVADQEIIGQIERDMDKGIYKTAYSAAKWDTYRNLKLSGVEAYLRHYATIKKTLTTPWNRGTIKANYDDAGKIVQYAAIPIPARARFQEPKYYDWDGAKFNPVSFEYYAKPSDVRWNETKKVYTISREWIGAPKTSDTYGGEGSFLRGGWSSTLYSGGSGIP